MNKILIIEDDQIVANIYRNKFAHEGFQAEVALDGHAGLELVHSFKPDAIVLDLMLPKLSGVEVMKKIRAEPALEKLPIIVFSNTYLTEMVQEPNASPNRAPLPSKSSKSCAPLSAATGPPPPCLLPRQWRRRQRLPRLRPKPLVRQRQCLSA